jgi:hypothetical protein
VAIDKLLKGTAFSSNEVSSMTMAYEAALTLLRVSDGTDPICELIAKKIVEVTQSGERDPPHICARAIRELALPIPD